MGGRRRRTDYVDRRQASGFWRAKEGMGSGAGAQPGIVWAVGDEWASGNRLAAITAVVDLVVEWGKGRRGKVEADVVGGTARGDGDLCWDHLGERVGGDGLDGAGVCPVWRGRKPGQGRETKGWELSGYVVRTFHAAGEWGHGVSSASVDDLSGLVTDRE
jgi:hypothetical protein